MLQLCRSVKLMLMVKTLPLAQAQTRNVICGVSLLLNGESTVSFAAPAVGVVLSPVHSLPSAILRRLKPASNDDPGLQYSSSASGTLA